MLKVSFFFKAFSQDSEHRLLESLSMIVMAGHQTFIVEVLNFTNLWDEEKKKMQINKIVIHSY